jgi:hypothetical protein
VNAIPADKRATQTSWQRTFQAQGMNPALRATELALITYQGGSAMPGRARGGPGPWRADPPRRAEIGSRLGVTRQAAQQRWGA